MHQMGVAGVQSDWHPTHFLFLSLVCPTHVLAPVKVSVTVNASAHPEFAPCPVEK